MLLRLASGHAARRAGGRLDATRRAHRTPANADRDNGACLRRTAHAARLSAILGALLQYAVNTPKALPSKALRAFCCGFVCTARWDRSVFAGKRQPVRVAARAVCRSRPVERRSRRDSPVVGAVDRPVVRTASRIARRCAAHLWSSRNASPFVHLGSRARSCCPPCLGARTFFVRPPRTRLL